MKHKIRDPNNIELCSDPVGFFRKPQVSKYDVLFKKMKPGNALKLRPTEVTYVSVSLRKYIEKNDLPWVAKQTMKYPGDMSDTCGRVWLLDAPKPALKRAA